MFRIEIDTRIENFRLPEKSGIRLDRLNIDSSGPKIWDRKEDLGTFADPWYNTSNLLSNDEKRESLLKYHLTKFFIQI